MLGKFSLLLFDRSSSVRPGSICGHRGPDPSGILPSRPFLPLMSLLCFLMGMSSKYTGGCGVVKVGLSRGSAVRSPESMCCTCRTCAFM